MQENGSLIDVQTVDEIFLMVPNILKIHQQFLDELRCRLDAWEPLQRVGDSFVKVVRTDCPISPEISLFLRYENNFFPSA